MKNDRLLDAIGLIDESLIIEAEQTRPRESSVKIFGSLRVRRTLVAGLAAIALLLVGTLAVQNLNRPKSTGQSAEAVQEEMVEEAAVEEASEEAAEEAAFVGEEDAFEEDIAEAEVEEAAPEAIENGIEKETEVTAEDAAEEEEAASEEAVEEAEDLVMSETAGPMRFFDRFRMKLLEVLQMIE